MSAKSGKNSKVNDRPFDPQILQRAKSIAAEYQIILWKEEGHFYGRGLELPTVFGDGKTPDQCEQSTRKSLEVGVAYLIERHMPVPPPASAKQRTEQVNVRLTAEEKLLLEEAARVKGFRGISDFVRSASLASVR
jgi:predicted RNase H-like HicB family nuclease